MASQTSQTTRERQEKWSWKTVGRKISGFSDQEGRKNSAGSRQSGETEKFGAESLGCTKQPKAGRTHHPMATLYPWMVELLQYLHTTRQD